MHGAYPYSTVGGSGGRRARRQGYGSGQGGAPVNPGGVDENQGPQATDTPDEPTAPHSKPAGPSDQERERRPVPAEPNAASPEVPPSVPADSTTARGDIPESGGRPGGPGQRPAGQTTDTPPSADSAPVTDDAPSADRMPPANSDPGPAPDIREEYGSDANEGDQS